MIKHLNYKTREAQVGCVADIQASIVGVFSFVLQPDIHHHSPPVSLYHPQWCFTPCFTQMAAEGTTRLHRLCTELTGREEEKLKENCKELSSFFLKQW